MDLRGPVCGIYRYPTIIIFCEGRGIATARALIEAGSEEGGLTLTLRQDVRLYYRVRSKLNSWTGVISAIKSGGDSALVQSRYQPSCND